MTEPSQINARVNTATQPARIADTAGAARSARAAVDEARASTRVALGSRVEVQVKAVHRSGDLEVQLRAQGASGQWSQAMRVGVTDSLRPALLDALRSLAASQGRGALLNAEVTSLTPRVMLKLLPSQVEGAPGTRAWLNAQLRQHLPGAQRLATTFAEWSRGLRERGVDRAFPQQELSQSVKQVLDRLASPRELTDPTRLAESLRNSGVWLEALLARAGASPEQRVALDADLKGQLLRLAGKLRAQRGADTQMTGTERLAQLSGGLSREVDGVLKQLVTLQLQNAENGPEQQRWTLELPFQTSAGLLTLDADIQREADQDQDDGEHWSMQIRLDLPVLGPLLIRLSLRDSRLHASLVAERGSSAELLREHLPELRAQLESRDLEIASLHAREGSTERKPPPRAPLLREQA